MIQSANRRLSIGLIASIVSVLVSLGISFLLTPYLISSLGKEAYSFYPLANNFVSYMAIITLALNSMASRFMTVELAKGNDGNARKYYSSIFYSNVLLSLILLIPMTLIVIFADRILNIPAYLVGDVRILFACVFTSMIINLLSSVFSISTFATEHMHWRSGWDIVQNTIRALTLVICYCFFASTIIYLGVTAVLVAAINGCVQYLFSKRLFPSFRLSIDNFDKSYVFDLVKSGIWNSINNLGSILTMNVAILVANLLVGVGEAGDLAIVQTMPNFATSIISAVYGVLLARLARVYAQGDIEATVSFVKDSQKVLGVITSVPIVLIMVFGKQFFSLWVPGQDAGYLQLLSVITMMPVLVHSSMWTVYGLNVTNNKLKVPALVLIVTGIISILVTVILLEVTELGIFAVPISSSICNTVFYFAFLPSYAARQMGVSTWSFYPHMVRTLLFTAIMLVIGYVASDFFDSLMDTWASFFAIAAIAEVVSVVMYALIVCTVNDRSRLIKLIKHKNALSSNTQQEKDEFGV